ncbi:hypothetical protein ACOMHN_061834 [Nucella lapillus]
MLLQTAFCSYSYWSRHEESWSCARQLSDECSSINRQLSGSDSLSTAQLGEEEGALRQELSSELSSELSKAWAWGDVGGQLQPTWIYSALLVTVIIGGMRTTRGGVLQLLQVCAGEIWGKRWLLSPYHVLAALLKGRRIPAACRRHLRWHCRTALRMLLGRRAVSAVRCGGTRVKTSGVKHGSKRRLNRTFNRSSTPGDTY